MLGRLPASVVPPRHVRTMSSTAKVLKLMSEDSADWLSSLEARGVVLHQVREVEIGIEEKVFVEEHELRVLKSLCPNLKTLTVKRLSWDKRRAPLALAGLEQLSVEASEYRKEWFDMKSLRSIKLQGLRDKSDELVITAEDNLGAGWPRGRSWSREVHACSGSLCSCIAALPCSRPQSCPSSSVRRCMA